MIAGTMFRTPEETALQLELLLLGTITDASFPEGPIAAAPLDDERTLRELRRLFDRVHAQADAGEEGIGVIGAISPAARAIASATIAAGLAARRPVTLLDADLRTGLLSFDARTYAQEGLVDVIRYGVRSPRVVAPTRVAGLSLLPVGSGTVDLAGTWAADSFDLLLRELSRTGDLLVVNGPGEEDLEDAAPFLDRVACWILVHEIGVSEPDATRRIRERIGPDRLLGVLVLHPGHAVASGREAPVVESFHRGGDETLRDLDTPVGEMQETEAPAAQEIETAPSRREPRFEDERFAEAGARTTRPSKAAPIDSPETEDEPTTAARRSLVPILLGVGALALAAVIVLPRLLTSDRGAATTVPGTSEPVLTPEQAERQAAELMVRMNDLEKGPSPIVNEPNLQEPLTNDVAARALPATPGGSTTPPGASTTTPGGSTTPPASTNPTTATPPAATVTPQTTTSRPPGAAMPPPAPVSPPSTSGPPPRAVSGGTYAVHMSSLHTELKANEDAARFRAAGFDVFVRRVDLGSKGVWHRVYVGPFEDAKSAAAAADLVRARGVSEYAQVQRISKSAVPAP